MFNCPRRHDAENIFGFVKAVGQMRSVLHPVTAVNAVVTVVAEEEDFPFPYFIRAKIIQNLLLRGAVMRIRLVYRLILGCASVHNEKLSVFSLDGIPFDCDKAFDEVAAAYACALGIVPHVHDDNVPSLHVLAAVGIFHQKLISARKRFVHRAAVYLHAAEIFRPIQAQGEKEYEKESDDNEKARVRPLLLKAVTLFV